MDLTPFTALGTQFVHGPENVQQRLRRIKAVLFDWDGVFNNGYKDAEGGSPFSEVDSMGVNLLRFALWLKNGERLPGAAIITGQHNHFAEKFGERERLHAVYMGFTHKPEAFSAFLAEYGYQPEEVAFFFDDVLDLPVAAECGLRVLIGRQASPWFTAQAMTRHVDVISHHDGGNHGLREVCELLISMLGEGKEVLAHRVEYSSTYRKYLEARQAVAPKIVRNRR